MKRTMIAAALLLLSSGLARAQNVDVQGVQIASYGIYTVDSKTIHHTATTQIVPALTGIRFGIQYTVTGGPVGTPVKLHEVVVYPPGGAHPPGQGALTSAAQETTIKIGAETRSDFYGFDNPWELIPGTWTFQVWYGNRKLAEQTFNVVRQ